MASRSNCLTAPETAGVSVRDRDVGALREVLAGDDLTFDRSGRLAREDDRPLVSAVEEHAGVGVAAVDSRVAAEVTRERQSVLRSVPDLERFLVVVGEGAVEGERRVVCGGGPCPVGDRDAVDEDLVDRLDAFAEPED